MGVGKRQFLGNELRRYKMKTVAKAVDEKTIEVVLQDGETEQRLLLIRSDILNKAIQLVGAAGQGEDGYLDILPGGCYDAKVVLYPDMEYALIVAKWWEHEFEALHISVIRHYGDDGVVATDHNIKAPWGIGSKRVENIIEVLTAQGYVMPTITGYRDFGNDGTWDRRNWRVNRA